MSHQVTIGGRTFAVRSLRLREVRELVEIIEEMEQRASTAGAPRPWWAFWRRSASAGEGLDALVDPLRRTLRLACPDLTAAEIDDATLEEVFAGAIAVWKANDILETIRKNVAGLTARPAAPAA